MELNPSKILVALVLSLGSLQLVGYLTGFEALRKLGMLSAASPLPLVFSHFRGLETFSPKFAVLVERQGQLTEIALTPSTYGLLAGPYNRRNVYGVAFAFGAVLKEQHERDLVEGVLRYGFCAGGPLRAILTHSISEGTISDDSRIGIRIVPKANASVAPGSVDLWVECSA
jgi:hypothetical protein